MDPALNQKKSSFPLLPILILVLSVLIIIAGLIIYKNYSQKTPSTSKKQAQIIPATANNLPSNFNQNLQNGPYRCPLPQSFCQDSKNYQNYRLVATFDKPTSIYASFEGAYEAQNASPSQSLDANGNPIKTNIPQDEYIIGTLFSPTRGLRAYYYYKGSSTAKKLVKEGTLIATASGQPLKIYQNNSFVFEILRLGLGKGDGSKVDFKNTDFQKE